MIRLSSFTILSSPLSNRKKVLLNGYTGALDIISGELADFFKHQMRHFTRGEAWFEKKILSEGTVAHLLERGHLTDSSHKDEVKLVAEIGLGLHEMEKKRPQFMIVPNMDCNYRCVYCFERHLQTKIDDNSSNINYSKNNVVLRSELVPGIFECIDTLLKAAGNCSPGGLINLYGGEPLDASNKQLLELLFREGAARGYWFHAITNGHSLDSFLSAIQRGWLRDVQMTIDGPKSVHDRQRISRDGCSSFDRILSNTRKALAAGCKVNFRVHLAPENLPDFKKVLSVFEAEGWTNNDAVIIYANTLYSKTNAGKVSPNIQADEIRRELQPILGCYNNVFTSAAAVHIARDVATVFEEGGRYPLKGAYCGANFGHYIFSPDEKIYTCWESLGKEAAYIGTYSSNGTFCFDMARKDHWFNRSVAEVDGCIECEFALLCGGGCAQYAEYNSGSHKKPFCNDFKETFMIALADEVSRRPEWMHN